MEKTDRRKPVPGQGGPVSLTTCWDRTTDNR